MPTASASVDENAVIERAVEDVFNFYQDFRNLPKFLGDVMRVDITGERTSRWTIQGPFGLTLHWSVVVIDIIPNAFISYQVQSAPASGRWEVSFAAGPGPGTTLVRERMVIPGGSIAKAALAALGKPPEKEVRANLARLKELLETGRVTTLDYAVPNKFSG